MNKNLIHYVSLLLVTIVWVSGSAQTALNGLWLGAGDFGSIEFKVSGEVVIVDNMSATMIGHYELEAHDLIKFEIIATDILRESVQPISKTVVMARIVKFEGNELQLEFEGQEVVITFTRIQE